MKLSLLYHVKCRSQYNKLKLLCYFLKKWTVIKQPVVVLHGNLNYNKQQWKNCQKVSNF